MVNNLKAKPKFAEGGDVPTKQDTFALDQVVPTVEQGAQDLGQAIRDKGAQMLDVSANLKRFNDMATAAAAGDPAAQQALAEHNATLAMGTLRSAPGVKVVDLPSQPLGTVAKPLGTVAKPLGTVANDISQAGKPNFGKVIVKDLPPAAPLGTVTNDIKQAGTPNYGKVIVKPFADGGPVDTSNLDSAYSQAFANTGDLDQNAHAAFDTPPVTPERSLAAVSNGTQDQDPNAPVHVINPQGSLVSIPSSQLEEALGVGYRAARPQEVDAYRHQQKYGTTGQMIKAGAEGLAEGVAGPFAPLLEKQFGVKPEDIRGREEVNPGIHMGAQIAGLVGGALTGTGEGALLEQAGLAAKSLLPKVEGGFVKQLGPEFVKHAFENALFQGGEELGKSFKENPDQTAQSAIADIGLASVLGGVFGGSIGALLGRSGVGAKAAEELHPGANVKVPGQFVSEADMPALEAGDLKASITHSDLIKPEEKESMLSGLIDRAEKSDAPQIKAAAKRLGAPVLEGMVSDNKWVQKAEDSLINGAPTFSGIRRAKLYNDAYNVASKAADEALGDESRYTKAELGDIMKSSIIDQFKEASKPIEALYNDLKLSHETIPLYKEAAPELTGELKGLTELRLSPSSPEGKMAARVIKEVTNLKTVDDVKNYKAILRRSVSPTAPSGEKRMAAILGDKLTDLEEKSVESFAKEQAKTSPEAYQRIMGLIDQRKAANKQYANLMGKISELAGQLGKNRVYGIQDATHFINDLTPESVTQKLFSKNNSEFLKFFSKEFPEQHALMQEYQKGALRASASKAGELSPKVLFNNINKLEPEIQKSIFNAQELQNLKDSETYLRSFPKVFNPSGTSGMSAFREFFNHPTGALISNARDLAVEKFITGAKLPPEVSKAVELAKSTVTGNENLNKAVKSVFQKGSFPVSILPAISHRDKLARMVEHYTSNPQDMNNIGDNNPIPEYAKAFATTSAVAVQYLNSLKPQVSQTNPLDTKQKPSQAQQTAYNRALDLAQQPLSIMDRMNKGTLTPQDVTTVKTIYPGLYQKISQKLMDNVIDAGTKGQAIPYSTRLQMSLFLGQPLDSTMTPQGILSAQPKSQASSPGSPTTPKGGSNALHGNPSKLNGIPKSAQTPDQARQARDQKAH